MIFDIRGPLAPVFTPFNDNGDINFKVIPEYMSHLTRHNVRGILVGGTTGEAMSLNVSERKSVLEKWLDVARPAGVKVIAQVGGVSLPNVLELAKHAEQMLVDAIMTLPELYYKPKTIEQLVSYLETVSAAAPKLPLIYYHFPMMSGVDVNTSRLFFESSSRIPNFKGMKADLETATQVADQISEEQKIFIANHCIGPAVLMGHDSSIATVTNIFPNIIHDIIEAVQIGDFKKARIQQMRINKLVNVISSQGDFVVSMKNAMALITGIKVGPPRRPLHNIKQDQKDYLCNNLKRLEIEIKL